MHIDIRRERPEDIAAIRETNELAFPTALEARLVDALRAAPERISLVAAIDDHIVGHILFTPVTLDAPAGVRLAGLAPMSVRPAHQRQGIGGRLIERGLEECRADGYSAVVLVGHPEYYPRFGFIPGHLKGLRCEFDVPPAAFMVHEIERDALDGVSGLVCFRPEFRQVSA